jgi:CTP-dependent riboflavin kinase
MDARTLQGRIARVEEKREFLQQLQTNPNLGTLSLDVDQALIEMDDLMAEFRQIFPDGVVREPIDPRS